MTGETAKHENFACILILRISHELTNSRDFHARENCVLDIISQPYMTVIYRLALNCKAEIIVKPHRKIMVTFNFKNSQNDLKVFKYLVENFIASP